jgi:hypothetical protein
LGGQRVWWRCPEKGCGRRVAVLYLKRHFACRTCHGLAYPTQKMNGHDRSIERANKIRRRMNWTPGVLNAPGAKPKGMHWSTYWRLRSEHDQTACHGMAGLLARLQGRL